LCGSKFVFDALSASRSFVNGFCVSHKIIIRVSDDYSAWMVASRLETKSVCFYIWCRIIFFWRRGSAQFIIISPEKCSSQNDGWDERQKSASPGVPHFNYFLTARSNSGKYFRQPFHFSPHNKKYINSLSILDTAPKKTDKTPAVDCSLSARVYSGSKDQDFWLLVHITRKHRRSPDNLF